ncbi:NAD(P)-dependent oxidoreductase [Flavobacterium sp. YO12]|uniref:NAD-dependent epimerase/dehydratase family protein n=1 Tax=Flavobacterium sp. YO12 TaxID=1920029 RepID=UPI00100BF960|nr:NAD(P)-dependent oxidoreductase [Flavobacterium sp. YO12]RXM48188.1 hypothetical protein BOW55_07610 [Flavobacterium sp. YO12]
MISIVGTNGLLANEFGLFFNDIGLDVDCYGRREPVNHKFNKFSKLDLINDNLDYNALSKSEVIIYACGAGIQSNLKDSSASIYNLNTFLPINIYNELNKINFTGTFVTFGSCFEIGNNSSEIKFTETEVSSSSLEVPNDYCVSKRLLTRFVSSKCCKSLKHLHIILPTIYGENEASHRLIPYTVSALKKNQDMQFTSGEQIRQYLYAGDVPKIVHELVLSKYSGIYNLAGEETYSVRNIIEKIYKFYDFPLDESLFGKAGRADVGMKNLQLDGTLIESIIPFFKYSKIEEVLKLYDKCY